MTARKKEKGIRIENIEWHILPEGCGSLVLEEAGSEPKNRETYLEATAWLIPAPGSLDWFDVNLLKGAGPLPLSWGKYASPWLNLIFPEMFGCSIEPVICN